MSSDISPAQPRSSEVRLLAGITAVVVLCGFAVAGAILFLTRGGDEGPCGKVNAGSLSDLVPRASAEPTFVAFGNNCQFWLALRDGKLVAVKPGIAALDCLIDWKPGPKRFFCGERQVTFSQLDYYPTSLGTGEFQGSWIVDFGDAPSTTTSSRASRDL